MNVKKIVLMANDGEPIALFGSVAELAQHIGAQKSTISYCLHHHSASKGYRFMLYSDYQRVFERGINEEY